VYIGFIHLQNLEKKIALHIVEERFNNGPFKSLNDFVQRIDIGREQLDILIRIGAFRFTGMNKYELMWEKNSVHNPDIKNYGQAWLLHDNSNTYEIPQLQEGIYDQAF